MNALVCGLSALTFAELPERARTGKLVIEESSKNLLIIGLKHNEFDSYIVISERTLKY